ncbi:C6 zinc finger domain-containing protein [Colletotrichum camelliae]|nr:C6 zinc finger domain-containing protein [Colletotrichum camelliae]
MSQQGFPVAQTQAMLIPHIAKKRPVSASDWDDKRDTIEYLYSIEGKKLSELMNIMEGEYGFVATQRQYKRQLGKWQIEKKVKRDEMRKILQIQKRRRDLDGKETAFIVRNQPVTEAKIKRFVQRTRIAASLRSPAWPTPHFMLYYTPRVRMPSSQRPTKRPSAESAKGAVRHNVSFTLNAGLMASNYAGNTKKSTASAIVFAGWAAGLIAGPQFFLESEAPTYNMAFKILTNNENITPVSKQPTPTITRDRPSEGNDRVSRQSPSTPNSYPTTFELDLSFETDYFGFDLAGESFDDFFPFPTSAGLADLTGVDSAAVWQSGADKSGALLAESSVQSHGDASDVINDDNRHLIQHYLEVIKGYSKVDDRAKESSNLFVSAFTQSLTFPPLLYAILAFSASHLSINDPTYCDGASRFNQLAEETFCQFRETHAKEIASLLSALFIRIKQLHVMGGSIDALFDLMTEVVEIVSTKECERALVDPNSLVRRIVLRLALLDARGTCFRLGRGKLVRALERIPALSFIFAFNTSIVSTPSYSLLRADILRHRIGEIEARLHDQLEAEFASSVPVRTAEIKLLYETIWRELERCDRDKPQSTETQASGLTMSEVLGTAEYNYRIVSSALHSAILYLSQVYVS